LGQRRRAVAARWNRLHYERSASNDVPEPLYDQWLGAVARESNNPVPGVLAGVQTAIRAKGDTVRSVADFLPGTDLTVNVDLENSVLMYVGEVDFPVIVYRGISGELVSCSE
jgi:hypothetical protein